VQAHLVDRLFRLRERADLGDEAVEDAGIPGQRDGDAVAPRGGGESDLPNCSSGLGKYCQCPKVVALIAWAA